MADRKIEIDVKIDDADALRRLWGIDQAIDKVGNTSNTSRRGLSSLETQFTRLGTVTGQLGRALTLGVTVPIVGIGVFALKSAIDFETAFTGVTKTVEATSAEFEAISQQLRQMSTEIPFTAVELANIGEIAGQLGVKAKDIVEFTRVIAQLGVSTVLTTENAAISVARFATIMGVAMNDLDGIASALVGLGNTMAANEEEILNFGIRLAAAGKFIGMAQEEVLAFGAAMAEVGVRAERGGTAMSKVWQKVFEAVLDGGDALGIFASVSNRTAEQFTQDFSNDPARAVADFILGLGNMADEGQNVFEVFRDLGLNNVRLKTAILALAASEDTLNKALQEGGESAKEMNKHILEAEKRFETAASKIQTFKGQLTDAAIELGDTMIEPLKRILTNAEPIVEWLKSAVIWFSELDPKIQTVALAIMGLAVVIGPLLLAFQGIAFAAAGLIGLLGIAGLGGAAGAAATSIGLIGAAAVGILGALAALVGSLFGVVGTIKDVAFAWDMLSKGGHEVNAMMMKNVESTLLHAEVTRGLEEETLNLVDSEDAHRQVMERLTRSTREDMEAKVAWMESVEGVRQSLVGTADEDIPQLIEAFGQLSAQELDNEFVQQRVIAAYQKLQEEYGAVIPAIDALVTKYQEENVEMIDGTTHLRARVKQLQEAKRFTVELRDALKWHNTEMVDGTSVLQEQASWRAKVTLSTWKLTTALDNDTAEIERNAIALELEEERLKAMEQAATDSRDALSGLSSAFGDLADMMGDSPFGAVVEGMGTMVASLNIGMRSIENFDIGKAQMGEGATLTGFANIAAGVMGMVGAIATGVSLAVKLFQSFGRSLEDNVRITVERWGVSLSEGLTESIAEASRAGMSDIGAIYANLGNIIEEAGGVMEFGLGRAIAKARDLFSMVQQGNLTTQEAGEVFNEVFAQILPHAIDKMTGAARADFLELIALAKEFGFVSEEMSSFLVSQATTGAAALTTLLTNSTHLTVDNVQAAADAALAFFGVAIEEGMAWADIINGPIGDAILAIPTYFEEIIGGDMYHRMIIDLPAPFLLLREAIEASRDEMTGPFVQAGTAAGNVLISLHNLALLDEEAFVQLGGGVTDAFNALIAGGVSGPAALLALRQPLGQLIFLQDEYGFEVDEATQLLLDMARQSGITGEDGKTDAQKLTTAMEDVASAMGIVVEELRELIRQLGLIPADIPVHIGITHDPLPDLDPGSGSGGNPPPGTGTGYTGGLITDHGIERFYRGGEVGYGLFKDDIPILAQSGEGILNRMAMANLGSKGLHAMNQGRSVGGGISVTVVQNISRPQLQDRQSMRQLARETSKAMSQELRQLIKTGAR